MELSRFMLFFEVRRSLPFFQWVFMAAVSALILLSFQEGDCAGWPDSRVHLLPDSSFVSIETDRNGNKIRHCPYRDSYGQIDHEQLVFVLGTLEEEIWISPEQKEIAKKKLEMHYQNFLKEQMAGEISEPMDINRAPLSQLVRLPRIGPVMAVRIVRYREKEGFFSDIREILKVEGIGKGTFNGLRFYIKAEPR